MIADTIKLLRSYDFYGGGKYTEIAKGKNQLVTNWSGFMRKLKRQWQLKRK
jgi:hypothetical protein